MTTNEQDLAYIAMQARYTHARDANRVVSEENRELRGRLATAQRELGEITARAKEFDELKAELETSRESTRQWKNELESVRSERNDLQDDLEACAEREFRAVRARDDLTRELNEALARSVKHIERGKWLTAEVYKWQDSCHEAQRGRNRAHRLLAEERQAPRAQVFDPALVRGLLNYQEEYVNTDEYDDYHLEMLCGKLRASENRAAEPYGVAETEAMIAAVGECHHDGGCRAHKLAEAVCNSRSAK